MILERLVVELGWDGRAALRGIRALTSSLLTSKKAVSAADVQLDLFASQSATAASSLAGLGKIAASSARIFGGVTVAAIAANVALARLAKAGGRVADVQTAFNARVGDGAAALAGLRRQTRGVISDYELMRQANTALALGSARSAEEFGQLADRAIRLSRIMGVDTTFALNSLNTGIARQSKLYLDNLGIIIDIEGAQKKYAEQVNKTADQLTDLEKRQAFTNAALTKADELIASFGGAAVGAAESVDRLGATIKNIIDRTTQLIALSPFVQDYFETLALWSEAAVQGMSVEQIKELASVLANAQPPTDATIEQRKAFNEQRIEFLEGQLADAQRRRGHASTGAQILAGQPQREAEQELRFLDALIGGIQVKLKGLKKELAPATAPSAGGGLFGLGDLAGGGFLLKDAITETRSEIQKLQAERAFATQAEDAAELNTKLAEAQARLARMLQLAGAFGGEQGLRLLGEQMTFRAPTAPDLPLVAGFGQARDTGRRAPITNPITGLIEGFGRIFERDTGRTRAVRDDAGIITHFERIFQRGGLITDPGALSPLTPPVDWDRIMEEAGGTFTDKIKAAGEGFKGTLDRFFDPAAFGSQLAAGLATQGIGIVAGVVGDVFGGLFGTGSQERALAAAMRSNAAAIERLTAGIGRLDAALLGVSGGDITNVRTAAQEFTAGFPFDTSIDMLSALNRALTRNNITMEDAERIARGFGITLMESGHLVEGAFQQLVEAINSDWIAQLNATFSGLDRLMRARFALFDIDDPMEQFRLRIDAMANAVPRQFGIMIRAIGQLGPEAFEQFARTWLDAFASGNINFELLGDVSPDDFLGWLIDTETSLDGLSDAADAAAGALTDINVPAGFKRELRVFQATDPVGQGGNGGGIGTGTSITGRDPGGSTAISGGDTVHVVVQEGAIVIQDVSDPKEAARSVLDFLRRETFARTGRTRDLVRST